MKLVLSILALALGALLFLQWRVVPVSTPAPVPAQSPGGAEAPLRPGGFTVPLGDPAGYAILDQRPLFTENRQPVSVDEQDAEEVADKGDLARYDFTAVVITPKGRVALVKDAKSGETVRLAEGGEIAGWSVKQVGEAALLLESDGKEIKIALREFKPPPPVRPRRPGAAVPRKPMPRLPRRTPPK